MSEIQPPQSSYTPPPVSGFNIGEWFNIWRRALTQPSATTFEQLERHPQVTMMNALIWDAIAGAIGGFLGGIIAMGTRDAGVGNIFTSAIFGALLGVIGLLVYALIVYAIARAQGGTGTFEIQVALLGTFIPPLLLITTLLGQIPIVGGTVGFLLAIYQIYLYIVATQAAQNITLGKAVIAVLLPSLLILCCLIAAALGLLAAFLPWTVTTSG
jgi:hypothetical protein